MTEERQEDGPTLKLVNISDEDTLMGLQSAGVTISSDGGKEYFSVEENLTTGYQWIVHEDACEPDVLKIESDYDPPADIENYVGAPGTRYFTLTGVGKGECDFKMAYARPWEFSWSDETTINSAVELVQFPVTVE